MSSAPYYLAHRGPYDKFQGKICPGKKKYNYFSAAAIKNNTSQCIFLFTSGC